MTDNILEAKIAFFHLLSVLSLVGAGVVIILLTLYLLRTVAYLSHLQDGRSK